MPVYPSPGQLTYMQLRKLEKKSYAKRLADGPVIGSAYDYSSYLHRLNVLYTVEYPYLKIGTPQQTQGWIIHLSCNRPQMALLLKRVLPFLSQQQVPYKIALNEDLNNQILNGDLGYEKLAKTVSIYPPDDPTAVRLVSELIDLTLDLSGPAIPTDRYLGGTVYVRYGAHAGIRALDASGREENRIFDASGHIIKDEYKVPFSLAAGMAWPFAEFASPLSPKVRKMFKGKYVAFEVIKTDSKGLVGKGIDLRKFWKLDWCLIKQGRKHMCMDDHGRDISDRLAWQVELQNDLSRDLPVPRVIDFFTEGADTYLVMEYIEGTSFHRVIEQTLNNTCWFAVDKDKRISLLDDLLDIIATLGDLHTRGYVHRDFTPGNIIKNKKGKKMLIDMELAYSTQSRNPTPPFTLGTYGFMSPEQLSAATPTLQEDLYTLGATMSVLFTGFNPQKFAGESTQQRAENLSFFIQDKDVAEVITRCQQKDPVLRPSLEHIRRTIQWYHDLLIKEPEGQKSVSSVLYETELDNVIRQGIQGLAGPLVSAEGLWLSKVMAQDSMAGTNRADREAFPGWKEGAAGILFFLGKAAAAGYSVSSCLKAYSQGWGLIENRHLNALPDIPAGLYGGAAGTAMTLASAITSGLQKTKGKYLDRIQHCFQIVPTGLDVANGMAGQGLALLSCASLLDETFAADLLKSYVNVILDAQQKDGFWNFYETGSTLKHKRKGFSTGAAGICYFLLAYQEKYPSNEVKRAVTKALAWLANHSKKKLQESDRKDKRLNLSLDNGIPGIALAFIKGYEVLQTPSFKIAAEQLLLQIPAHISHSELSLYKGLAGIGEVYLEAARTLQNTLWMERAEWITQVLLHLTRKENAAAITWQVDNTHATTADFLTGQAGVLHFLIRVSNPSRTSFPFAL
jgi:serine/threonine protein kinase